MSKRGKKSQLGSQEFSLLEEILEQAMTTAGLVDAVNFRIAHPNDRKALEDLQIRRLLAIDSSTYRVTLLGLDALQTATSRELLSLGDKFAEALRQRFANEELRRKEFHVSEIAELLGVNVNRCLATLAQLKEAIESWSGGRSATWPRADAWILPSENAFAWPTTRDLIRQLREWNKPERVQRKNALRSALIGQAIGTSSPVVAAPPIWYQDLPARPLRVLFGEIHRARQLNCRALVVLGLRTALDTMCNELWGDIGTFQAKLQRLQTEGYIGRLQHDQLATAIAIGNATTHRGHIPTTRDTNTVYDIVETLIRQHYSLRDRASVAAKRVPSRMKAKEPQ